MDRPAKSAYGRVPVLGPLTRLDGDVAQKAIDISIVPSRIPKRLAVRIPLGVLSLLVEVSDQAAVNESKDILERELRNPAKPALEIGIARATDAE